MIQRICLVCNNEDVTWNSFSGWHCDLCGWEEYDSWDQ